MYLVIIFLFIGGEIKLFINKYFSFSNKTSINKIINFILNRNLSINFTKN